MYNRYPAASSHSNVSYLVNGSVIDHQPVGLPPLYMQQQPQPHIQHHVYVQQPLQQSPLGLSQPIYLQQSSVQQHSSLGMSQPIYLQQPIQQPQQQPIYVQQHHVQAPVQQPPGLMQRRPSLGRPVTIIQKEEVQELEKLGEGAFGRVYKALWRGRVVAVKKITGQMDSVVMSEIEILWRLRHPNVAEMLGVIDTNAGGEISIVTEFYNSGSLYDLLHVKGVKLSLEEMVNIATDVAKAMTYLHDYHITHRDIKSQNILLQKEDTTSAIVADFGVAKMTSAQTVKLATQIGTPNWMAPEIVVLNAKKGYDNKVDVYSFGLVLFEMMTNTLPYAGLNAIQIGFCLSKGERPSKPKECARTPKELISLMTRCWAQEPEKRPSFDEVRGELKMIHNKYCAAKKRFSFSF
eukprot:TRINITY_DN432_c0_g1_i1.p1 TRINITY_DN432_c0_g1~~TRINITY_DN432_c0_g1_i1.p1  ORF type:complete len:406 (-),score=87.49 TRINITY_DN432_c0_g1_i1:56-1273(-)